jgi:endonuclease YncB( thermonuclease family)
VVTVSTVAALTLAYLGGSALVGALYGLLRGRYRDGPFGAGTLDDYQPPARAYYVTGDYETKEVVDARAMEPDQDRCSRCADVTGFGLPARTRVVCTGKCREVAVVGHPMPALSWQYHAKPVRAVDGDTVVLQFDLGFRVLAELRVRLYGVNAPEKHGGTLEDGEAAMAFTEAWLEEAVAKSRRSWPLVVFTAHHPLQHSVDEVMETSFDRFIARIWRVSDERCLNDDLLGSGNAVVFMDTGQ